MTPLKIAAASTVLIPATETPTPVRPLLQAVLPNSPRRISRMIELTLLGAHRCLKGARPETHCPLYLALTHGSVAENVMMVRMSAQGQPPPPVSFINVSSNMGGFYVASTLGIHGSNQAVAADDFPFEAALELASLWREHRSQALIGAIEECAWPLAEHRQRFALPPDAAMSESSHWLFVDQNALRPLATVAWVRRYDDAATARAALTRERWPDGGRIAVSRNLLAQRAEWARATGLAPHDDDVDSYSGQWSAYRVCRFVESGAGSCLLHVSAGQHGCYAVFVTR
jgi:hypothetical protein